MFHSVWRRSRRHDHPTPTALHVTSDVANVRLAAARELRGYLHPGGPDALVHVRFALERRGLSMPPTYVPAYRFAVERGRHIIGERHVDLAPSSCAGGQPGPNPFRAFTQGTGTFSLRELVRWCDSFTTPRDLPA